MPMSSVRSQLLANFQGKKYRDLFVAEQIFSGLPAKIRSMRMRRFDSQGAFADALGKKQSWVSQLENPNYGRLTLTTLLEIAAVFDVGLRVDFVPFSKVLDAATSRTREWFDVPSYREDQGLAEVQIPTPHGAALGWMGRFAKGDQPRRGLTIVIGSTGQAGIGALKMPPKKPPQTAEIGALPQAIDQLAGRAVLR